MLLYLFVFMRTNLCNAPVIVENTYTVARGYYSIANINLRTMVAVQRTIQGLTTATNTMEHQTLCYIAKLPCMLMTLHYIQHREP